MGKILIIKGADFSANAVENIDVPTPPVSTGHNFISFNFADNGNGSCRAVYNQDVAVGKKVGFVNPSMFTKYKFAIGKTTDYWPNGGQQWDTTYSGASYINENITIKGVCYQIMIAPIDGSSITESQVAEINNNTFYID